MTSPADILAEAVRSHQAGNRRRAEDLYRQLLRAEPFHADALHLLGILVAQDGRREDGLGYLQQAVALQPANAAFHANLGMLYQALGRRDEAAASYRQALLLQPGLGEIHYELGNSLLGQGQAEEAAACFRQALALKPDARSNYKLGVALREQGKLDEAVSSFREALRLERDLVEAHQYLALAYKAQNRLDEAVASYQEALRLKPDCAATHYNLGNALQAQGKLPEAAASYEQAFRLNPDHVAALQNLGVVLRAQGKLDEAADTFRQALRLRPDDGETHFKLAATLLEQHKLDEAAAGICEGLRLKPDDADAHFSLGAIHMEQGKLDEATACYREALRLDPDHASSHHNLAMVLREQGRLDESVAGYRRALGLKPDEASSHFGLAITLLLQGQFAEGWREYEWRWQTEEFTMPDFAQPLWDGSPLDGRTILLHTEQGLGDTMHFIRYAPLVRARGGRLVVACQAALLPLLARCPGIDLAIDKLGPLPAFHTHAPLLSLPGIFKTDPASIPAPIPYIHADPALAERWAHELRDFSEFKIGIAWQGNPTTKKDYLRSIPLVHFEAIANVKGVRLFSLQKGAGAKQAGLLAERVPLIDWTERMDQAAGAFMDTAALMKNLDLVITSDTAAAHLAGALGVPVWVALRHVPEWRWLMHRQDSPWYPTMRLFRQTERGNWTGVFERIADELDALIASRQSAVVAKRKLR